MQCRACMRINCAAVVDLSATISNDGKTLYDYFNDCTQLQANSMDKLPQNICTNCKRKLQVAYDFRQAALQTNALLLGNHKINENDEVLIEPIYQSEDLQVVNEYKDDPLRLPEACDVAYETTMEPLSNIKEAIPFTCVKSNVNQEQLAKRSDFETSVDDKVLREDRLLMLKCKTKHICELCSSKYSTKNELTDHLFNVHLSDIICIECAKVYEFPHQMQIHESLVHGTEPNVQCLRCNEFLTRTILARHFQKCHPSAYSKYFPRRTSNKNSNNNPRIYCDDCQHDFSTILELANHIKNHKFDCPICMMSFQKHTSYRAHIKRVHKHSLNSLKAMLEGNEEDSLKTPFNCALCSSKFRLNRTYRLHMKNVHNQIIPQSAEYEKEKKLYECEICNLLFNSRSARQIHKKRKRHLKPTTEAEGASAKINKNYKQCTLCSKKFKCQRLYLKHMLNVHNIDNEVYLFECEFCHMGFKLRASMYMHRRRKHPEILIATSKTTNDNFEMLAIRNEIENNELIECKYCYKLIEGEKMKKHAATHVYNQRRKGKYLCAFCPREYKYDTALKRHEKMHRSKVNAEPTECPICQKIFKQTYLKLHIRRYHNADRRHICTYCGATFKSHNLLYNHKQLHAERNLACVRKSLYEL